MDQCIVNLDFGGILQLLRSQNLDLMDTCFPDPNRMDLGGFNRVWAALRTKMDNSIGYG